MHGHNIERLELREYIHGKTPKRYSTITAFVRTDQHSVEMVYDQGYRGDNALHDAASFLVSMLGVSGLVLRALIMIQEYE